MKQPKALVPLFMTEMWERFGVYVVQGLLVLYFTNYLGFTDDKAYVTQANFSSLLYMFPVLGGLFADRIMGHRNTILVGAVFLGIGYFSLAFFGSHVLLACLALVVLGTAFIKPNISSFLGEFYYEDDPRRNSGFTLFYMGFNIGILLSTATSGFIQEKFGWGTTFATAGAVIVLAVVIFCLGYKYYENRGLPPVNSNPSPILRFFQSKLGILIAIIMGFCVAFALFLSSNLTEILLLIMGILTFLILLITAFQYDRQQRNKLIVLILLIVSSIIFWGIYLQIFASVNLFVERNVERTFFGILLPPPVYLSLISVFILILAPIFAKVWERLHLKKKEPSLGIKFALSLIILGISMLSLALCTHHLHANGLISSASILPFYLLLTAAELFISPIGLSMVTELAPPNLVGLMMGVWFMALGFGGTLAGYIAKLASVPREQINNPLVTSKIYGLAFLHYAMIAFIAGIVIFILSPYLKRLLK